MWVLATVPFTWVEPPGWVRVDDPDHPEAIARSATGALLAEPPADGTAWRLASFPEPDQAVDGVPSNEAVDVTNAGLWHEAGITGRGVSIAVFDLGWFSAEADPDDVGAVETHDCFRSTTCEVPFDVLRPNSSVESGTHGWGCAEIAHEVAPGAELHLVRVNTFTMLENAVAWAIRDGVDVITMSMSFYNESFYDGTGPHDALLQQLEAADVLMVTSAGNNARQHWDGPFVDADADGRLDGDGDNGIWVYLDARASMYVNWNQYGRCGETDLDVYVVDVADGGRTIIGASALVQDAEAEDCVPTERFSATPPRADWYRVEVVHRRGPRAGLHVDFLTRSGSLFEPTPSRSVTDPAAHPLAVAVGAVPAADYWGGDVQPYSAWGPNHAGHPKPDIVGPDGLSLDASGPNGFSGTSGSAPVVAGLIALVMEQDPSLTPRQAFERLAGWARDDRASPGPDPAVGAGRARLPVLDPQRAPCGQRPLLLPLVLPLLWWRRKREETR